MVFTRCPMEEHLGHGICGRVHDGTTQEAIYGLYSATMHCMGHPTMVPPWYILWGTQLLYSVFHGVTHEVCHGACHGVVLHEGIPWCLTRCPLKDPLGHGLCSRVHHVITYSTHETIHGIDTSMVTSMGHPIVNSMAHSVGSIIV